MMMYSKKTAEMIVLGVILLVSSASGNLVHYWTLDADGTDLVSGFNGTVQGPVVVPGMVGNGLLFDGVDDSVEFTDFVPPLQGTIVFWMNAASVGPRGRFMGSVDEFEAYVEDGLLANQLFSAGSLPNYVVSNTILVENTWYHVALTYDGASNLQQIYINGQLDAEGATADDIWAGGNFAFGHRAGRTNQYYSGILDDVQYYDQVLTAEEIQELLQDTAGLASEPLARYTFDDGTALDVTGNGYDGILLVNPDDPNVAAEVVDDPNRGQVLKLNGSISMLLDGPFNITTSMTLSFWAKFESGRYFFTGPFTVRTDRQDTDDRDWIEFRYPENDKVNKHNPKSEANPLGFLDGQWHHYAFVLDSEGNNYAYFDGVLLPTRDDAVKAHDFGSAVGPIFVGRESDGMVGCMDDIRIYNYAVGAEAVPDLMGDLTQPLAQYTFDDGTALDVTGNGYDGILLVNLDDPNVAAEVVDDPNRGQVLKLNGSISMLLDGPFNITTSMTLSFWAKFESGRYFFTGPFTVRTDRQDTDDRDWIEFRYPENDKVNKHNPKSEANPLGFLDGQWHHYAFVLDSEGNNYAYFDGVLLPTRDDAVKAHDFGGAVGPIFVGRESDGMVGCMDEIALYNVALGVDVITDIMLATTPIITGETMDSIE